MKLTRTLVYILGFLSGFCFSVFLHYSVMTSGIKIGIPRRLSAADHVTQIYHNFTTQPTSKWTSQANETKSSELKITKPLKRQSNFKKHYEFTLSYKKIELKEKTEYRNKTQDKHKAMDNPLQRYVKHVQFHSKYIQCGRIFDGSKDEIRRTNNYLLHNNHSFHESLFINVTRDCNEFKKVLGYHRQYSKSETDFPLAFGILTHDNVEQLERLLRVLYAPHNVYCIHVDSKSPKPFLNAVKSLTDCFPNVFVTSRLERVIYAHFSRLRAEMNCIEDLLNRSNTWKYYLNIASSELPLKTNLEIVNYLKSIKGANDIAESVERRNPNRYIFRYAVWGDTIHRTRILNPTPPHNLTMTKGQAYGAFSRKFLEFTLTNKMAVDLFRWSKNTHSPDEQYWATLNNLYHNPFLNTPGGSKAVPEHSRYNGRFVKWLMGEGYCKGKFRHNICVFGVGDLPDLRRQNKLIANKFDISFDPFAVACMEEYLRNKTATEVK